MVDAEFPWPLGLQQNISAPRQGRVRAQGKPLLLSRARSSRQLPTEA